MITSFRHDEWKKKRNRRLLWLCFSVALVILSVRGPVTNLLGGGLAIIGRPFWSLEDGIVSSYTGMKIALSSKSTLEAENQQLRDVLDKVALDAYSRDTLRIENDELKRVLGRQSEYQYMFARIMSAPPISPYDTILIDAGKEQGVYVGMQVFASGDFKVGEVSRVWGRSALVSLYSTPNTELSVTVGTSSIPAIASGMGGGNLRIILPKGVAVTVGNLVSIPALAPTYAGTVDAIERTEGSSLEAIYVRLPFNISQETKVYLAFPKKELEKILP